jgi:hypothetical protein
MAEIDGAFNTTCSDRVYWAASVFLTKNNSISKYHGYEHHVHTVLDGRWYDSMTGRSVIAWVQAFMCKDTVELPAGWATANVNVQA